MIGRTLFGFLLCFAMQAGSISADSALGKRNWYRAAWSGSNAPYEKARSGIQGQMPPKARVEEWLAAFRRNAEQNPGRALEQFKYAYAAYLVAQRDGHHQERMVGPLERMLRMPPPYTREYYRLLFLIEFNYFPNPSLKGAGRRLVRELPEDMTLSWQLALLLSHDPDVKAKREAFALTGKVVKAYPKDVSLKFTLAMRGYGIYVKTKDRRDAAAALAVFKDFIAAAPENKVHGPYRSVARSYVRELESFLKHGKA